jgi:hypothetical protein
MSENEILNVPVETEPKKRGNPNWGKKKETNEQIVRASVISENIANDSFYVGNKDPQLTYKWGRKSDAIEMNEFARKGYAPARGSETVLNDPFAAVQDDEGKTKEVGDRILMCCRKELVDARESHRVKSQVSVKDAAREDARKISGKGVVVKPIGEETTKRESLME